MHYTTMDEDGHKWIFDLVGRPKEEELGQKRKEQKKKVPVSPLCTVKKQGKKLGNWFRGDNLLPSTASGP